MTRFLRKLGKDGLKKGKWKEATEVWRSEMQEGTTGLKCTKPWSFASTASQEHRQPKKPEIILLPSVDFGNYFTLPDPIPVSSLHFTPLSETSPSVLI